MIVTLDNETVEYWDAQEGPLESPRHTRHVYDGLQAVEEYECGPGVPACGSGWSLAREFVWGGRFPEPIAMVDHTAAGLLPANQPEVLHYLHDVLGSVIGLTNAAGTLVERYTYDPYGKTLVERRDPLTGSFELNGADGNFPTWSAFGNPLMWTAQRYDALTGTYHFPFRTYSPAFGRWLQWDLLEYYGSSNLYEYVLGAPLFWVDPLGLEPDDFDDAIGALNRHRENAQKAINKGAQAAQTGLEVAARLNPISDVAEAVTGKDIITGEKLGAGDRLLAGAGDLLPET